MLAGILLEQQLKGGEAILTALRSSRLSRAWTCCEEGREHLSNAAAPGRVDHEWHRRLAVHVREELMSLTLEAVSSAVGR